MLLLVVVAAAVVVAVVVHVADESSVERTPSSATIRSLSSAETEIAASLGRSSNDGLRDRRSAASRRRCARRRSPRSAAVVARRSPEPYKRTNAPGDATRT